QPDRGRNGRLKSMTSKASHHRSRKGRANARPLQDSETIASTDDDEILESLIDTFPASDPPAGLRRPVSVFPNENRHRGGLENQHTSDRLSITCSPSGCACGRCRFLTRTPPSPDESQFGVANTARQVSNSS